MTGHAKRPPGPGRTQVLRVRTELAAHHDGAPVYRAVSHRVVHVANLTPDGRLTETRHKHVRHVQLPRGTKNAPDADVLACMWAVLPLVQSLPTTTLTVPTPDALLRLTDTGRYWGFADRRNGHTRALAIAARHALDTITLALPDDNDRAILDNVPTPAPDGYPAAFRTVCKTTAASSFAVYLTHRPPNPAWYADTSGRNGRACTGVVPPTGHPQQAFAVRHTRRAASQHYDELLGVAYTVMIAATRGDHTPIVYTDDTRVLTAVDLYRSGKPLPGATPHVRACLDAIGPRWNAVTLGLVSDRHSPAMRAAHCAGHSHVEGPPGKRYLRRVDTQPVADTDIIAAYTAARRG